MTTTGIPRPVRASSTASPDRLGRRHAVAGIVRLGIQASNEQSGKPANASSPSGPAPEHNLDLTAGGQAISPTSSATPPVAGNCC
jgi:hypothetical protein